MSIDLALSGAALARGLGRPVTIVWPLRRSDELFSLRYGKALVETTRRAGPVPVYGTNGQTGTHDTPLFKGPGVILGRKGMGHLGVEWTDRDFWVIDTAYSLETNANIDLKFAYYLIRYVGLDHLKHGTSNPSLTREAFAAQLFPVPRLQDQRGIAATLGSLDDKIESNRRQLRLTDELLQTRWWKTAYEAPEARRRLGDVVSTQYGLTASADTHAAGPKFLRVTDINKRNWISWTAVPSVEIDAADLFKYQLHKGDLLVARMADPGKSAIYDETSIEAVFASYLVRLRCPSYDESLYVYGFLKSSLYAEYAAGAMTGSVQKNMNARVIVDVDVPWPRGPHLAAFAAAASPLRQSINQRVRENAQLTVVRDALLPELLSGRIRVPEARELVEEAVG